MNGQTTINGYILGHLYEQDPTSKLRGVDPGIYEYARSFGSWVDWEEVGADVYWALDHEGAIDGSDTGAVLDLYQCDGCKRFFPGGDTQVTDEDGEFCYADNGNGCRDLQPSCI